MLGNLGPHGNVAGLYGTFDKAAAGKNPFLTGALSALGLHQQSGQGFVKGGGLQSVTLTGAQAVAQAETLEGISISIYVTGAQMSADAGTVSTLPFDDPRTGNTPTNPTATSDVPSYYEIDDRTGFKVYPHWHPLSKAKEDGYGWRTVSGDERHPQEAVKSRGNDKATGPQFAEPDDSFISTSVSPEDL